MSGQSGAPARPKNTLPLVVALVAALVTAVMLIAPAVFGDGGDDSRDPARAADSTTTAQEGDDPLAALVRREPGDPLAVGDVDAPVVMVNFSEFQCPFCGKFARDTKPTLMEKYVEDGTLRIEWRDFPYLGEESLTAAVAARAAAEQGKFWEFHDALFANQLPPNSGQLTTDHFVGVAEEIGLDVEQFRKDLGKRELQDRVTLDFQEGQAVGITGTPAFIVNGVPIIGAQPTDVFVDVIEQAAADAR